MKTLFTIIIILLHCLSSFAQKNNPIFILEDIGAVHVIPNSDSMLVVEDTYGVTNLVMYDIGEKEKLNEYSVKLPDEEVYQIYSENTDLFYLVTIRYDKPAQLFSPNRLLDAIYTFESKKNSLHKIYDATDSIPALKVFGIDNNNLLLSTHRFGEARILNIDTKEIVEFSSDKDLRVFCYSNQEKEFGVVKISEVENNAISPVYVMDEVGKTKQIGHLNMERRAERSGSSSSSYPYLSFTLTDSNYDWIETGFNLGGLPVSGLQLIWHSYLGEKILETPYMQYTHHGIAAASQNYMVLNGSNNTWVYNIKDANLTPAQTVDETDYTAIYDYFKEKLTSTKVKIESTSLEQIFLADFYDIKVKLTFPSGGGSVSSNMSHIAFSHNDKYSILENESYLINLIEPEYKISTPDDANQIKEALSLLFPLRYGRKQTDIYKKENTWYFPREASFNEMKAFQFHLDEENRIDKIEYITLED